MMYVRDLTTIPLVILLSFGFTCSIIAQVANKDWPQVDGFSERTNYIESSMAPPFNFEESMDLGLQIADFTIANQVIYFSSPQTNNTFKAVDLQTGTMLWERSLPNTRGSVGVHPAVSENLVYIGGQGSAGLYALDRLTGDSVWSQPIGNLFGRNFAIKGEFLYVYVPNDNLHCYDKSNGQLVWEFGANSIQTVPLVDDNNVFHHSADTIFSLHPETGDVQWTYSKSLDAGSAMLSINDVVYFKSRTDFLALSAIDGQLIWDRKLPAGSGFISTWNALTWTPEMIVVQAWQGDWRDTFVLQGFSPLNGDLKWSHKIEVGPIAPSTAFGDYFTLVNGRTLEIRDPSTGNLIEDFPLYSLDSRSRAKATEGAIYAANGSTLYKFVPETSSNPPNRSGIKWWISNASKGAITIEIESSKTLILEYKIVDALGRVIGESEKVSLEKGSRVSIPVNGLSPGTYNIVANNKGQFFSLKFIVI